MTGIEATKRESATEIKICFVIFDIILNKSRLSIIRTLFHVAGGNVKQHLISL